MISSLFSLLASRAAARPGKVQTLLQYSWSSVVGYFHKGLPASVCALPASQFSSFHFCEISLCVTNMGKCKPCCSAILMQGSLFSSFSALFSFSPPICFTLCTYFFSSLPQSILSSQLLTKTDGLQLPSREQKPMRPPSRNQNPRARPFSLPSRPSGSL